MADTTVTGMCTGGPLDGQQVIVRSSSGFLAVNKPAGRAWMYVPHYQGWRVCTDHDDSLIYPQGATTGERQLDDDRVWQAGVDSALDIVAVGA
jgi:hypothetical protein